jgi:hypothetical protein
MSGLTQRRKVVQEEDHQEEIRDNDDDRFTLLEYIVLLGLKDNEVVIVNVGVALFLE